jgi:hypothetical protein
VAAGARPAPTPARREQTAHRGAKLEHETTPRRPTVTVTGRDDVDDDPRARHPAHTTIQVVADKNGTTISDLAARDIVQTAR